MSDIGGFPGLTAMMDAEALANVYWGKTCPPLRPVPPYTTDLTGQQFGKLTVVGLYLHKHKTKSQAYWVARCECGDHVMRFGSDLRNSPAASCRKCRTGNPDSPQDRALRVLDRLCERGGSAVLHNGGDLQTTSETLASNANFIAWLLSENCVEYRENAEVRATEKGLRIARARKDKKLARREAAKQSVEARAVHG